MNLTRSALAFRRAAPAHSSQYNQCEVNRAYEVQTALEYGIPKSTLGDQVSGRVTHDTLSGPPRYPSSKEEELVSFFCGCVSMDYAKSCKELSALVESLLTNRVSLN